MNISFIVNGDQYLHYFIYKTTLKRKIIICSLDEIHYKKRNITLPGTKEEN